MGRTSDGRDRLVKAASRLLSQRSYSSIGVAEICAAAGVQKGSFYYYFESKQALALAVIDEHWKVQRESWARILQAPDPLLKRLRGLFLLTAEVQTSALRDAGTVTGCVFGNLALEMSGQDEVIRDRLQGIFEEQIDLVAEAIADAAGEANNAPANNPRESATSIVAQLEGLIMIAKLFNDPGQLDRLWQNSVSLLGMEETPAA